MNNNKPAIAEQTKEYILWANSMLEVQNEVLQQSCSDYRKKIVELMAEIETLKTTNAVLKCTVQRITGGEVMPKEYIEREASITKLNDIAADYIKDNSIQCSIAAGTVIDIRDNVVMKAPAADIAEVRHGEWLAKYCIKKSNRGRVIHYATYKCSVCGKWNGRHKPNYCPNCGTKMDGATDTNVGGKDVTDKNVEKIRKEDE